MRPASRHKAAALPLLGNAAVLLALVLAALALLPLHDDAWWTGPPRGPRWTAAAFAVAGYAVLCLWLWRRTRTRGAATASGAELLVAWASQTGFAQQIAQRTADALAEAGVAVQLRELAEVDAAMLRAHGRALFVASTTGEGDPPDPALAFVRDTLDGDADLSGLRYAVLALGDREYAHFCGFGHRIERWLRHAGAAPLFDLIEVDNGDPGALRHWQHHLGLLAGAPELPDWSPAGYASWRLRERREANPGSAGGAAYHLVLQPPANAAADWQAGDIAEIGPRNAPAAVDACLTAFGLRTGDVVTHAGERLALGELLARSHLPAPTAAPAPPLDAQALADTLAPLPHREYSIASLPQDGGVHLLVRRMLREDGRPGLGSGWLCDHAPLGGEIALRIRANRNFHPPAPERPLILVGNGTGIAGLRAHLKARVAAGARRNWLLFGERNAGRDFFYGEEIRAWQAGGFLAALDLAFSRDADAPPHKRYVQHHLREAGERLRAWIDEGAAVYVCGSLEGMAPGVDEVMREALGEATVDAMLIDGRYRRDVY
ncbi:sulfite reductase subunit alpha [Luteimonas aquatica]|uniref:sulfite reductase subunit alpha n=1 Tax=Luteimonas aquatica TaxID=450364 RepID=UPI001F5A3783|nr:sulfite reductase flavoprotein subunit alpha [Luteimonas aquatica]